MAHPLHRPPRTRHGLFFAAGPPAYPYAGWRPDPVDDRAVPREESRRTDPCTGAAAVPPSPGSPEAPRRGPEGGKAPQGPRRAPQGPGEPRPGGRQRGERGGAGSTRGRGGAGSAANGRRRNRRRAAGPQRRRPRCSADEPGRGPGPQPRRAQRGDEEAARPVLAEPRRAGGKLARRHIADTNQRRAKGRAAPGSAATGRGRPAGDLPGRANRDNRAGRGKALIAPSRGRRPKGARGSPPCLAF